ncbi:magnesium-transporting ATPase (P-type) [Mucilaginibacter sp. HD30]
MPIKGNQFKSNSFREENSPRQPSDKGAKVRSSRPVSESMPVFNLQDGRVIKIAGLFFLILSIFFLIAFTSYLFTWEQDQSYVSANNGGWSNLFKTQAELLDKGITDPVVDNWLGKFGALLSNQFIFEWFGVASFVFVFVFFIIGYRMLFKVRIFSLGKTLGYSFFVLIFLSVCGGVCACLYY